MKASIYRLNYKDEFYIGSTIQLLKYRLNSHKNRPMGNLKKITDWSIVDIILLEEFECNNNTEIYKKETQYIKENISNPLCMNIILPYVSKDDKKIQRADKIYCKCGKNISKGSFKRHLKNISLHPITPL